MSLFPEGNGLNKNHDPGIWSTTPEFGSKRTPHLRSTVLHVQRHMAYFAKLVSNEQFVTVFLTSSPSDVAGDPDVRSRPIIGSDAD